MGFITVGLFAIVVGMMLLDVRDTPTNWHPWDILSLLLMIAGGVAVLVGMAAHVVSVNRGDR